MLKEKVKIGLMLDAVSYEQCATMIKRIGLRRDVMFNRWLKQELEYLKKMKPLDKKAVIEQKVLRTENRSTHKKVVFTLDRGLVAEIDDTCKIKGIPRGAFVENCIRYLNEGDDNTPGGCLDYIEWVVKKPREWSGIEPYSDEWLDDQKDVVSVRD